MALYQPKLDAVYGTEGMGSTAENLVDLHSISREDQDRFAALSQQQGPIRPRSGHLAEEIAPVHIPRRKQEDLVFAEDEFIKRRNNQQKYWPSSGRLLERKGGSVTAGNSSGLNDGACALLMSNDAGIERWGLRPLARVVSSAVVGVEPRIMGIGPVEASKKALQRSGLSLEQMDHIELNEAFRGAVPGMHPFSGLAR